MYERLIQKLINRNVSAIAGNLRPTGGTNYCTIYTGKFSDTYDGRTTTACCFHPIGSCLCEWYWDTPVNVTKFNMYTLNYPLNSDIYRIWGRVDGSWVELWDGTWIPSYGVWSSKAISCNNCDGIRIGQHLGTQHAVACITEVTVDYEEVTTTSCTASFQETSVNVGDTIHANFTWANAVKRGLPYLHYAVMNIKDPNGNLCGTTYFELTKSSGSKSLSCVTNMAGTWTCKIDVWQGAFYVPCTDTVSVTSIIEETLTEAVTCKWVTGFRDHGSKVTRFDINETVYAYAEIALHGQDAYGKIMKHEWWYNGVKRWEWQTTCSSHYTNNWSSWTYWAIGQTYGAGTGYIKIFYDGVYMGKTNDFTMVGEGDATIISVDKPSSFTPNVPFHVKPRVRNDGVSDTLFMGLTDTDTGEVLKHPATYTFHTASGTIWEQDWEVTLDQIADFHGRVDAGHVE